jgi:hypothetical protein
VSTVVILTFPLPGHPRDLRHCLCPITPSHRFSDTPAMTDALQAEDVLCSDATPANVITKDTTSTVRPSRRTARGHHPHAPAPARSPSPPPAARSSPLPGPGRPPPAATASWQAWPAAALMPTVTATAAAPPRPGWASRPAAPAFPPRPPWPRSASASRSPPNLPRPLSRPAALAAYPLCIRRPVEPAARPERQPGRHHARPPQSLSVEHPDRRTGKRSDVPEHAITPNYMALTPAWPNMSALLDDSRSNI